MAADTTYPGSVVQIRQDGNLHVPTGKSIDLESGSSITVESGATITINGTYVNPLSFRTVKVALAAGVTTAGGIFSWANPEAVTIIVTSVVLDVTTVSTGACGIDVGTTAVSGTTAGTNFFSNADIHSATGQFSSVPGGGTVGGGVGKLATAKWVTGSAHSAADSTGLVGSVYISYILA